MTITIRLKTDNAAFEDKDAEVARIVQGVAKRLYSYGPTPSKLMDYNGNAVGTVTITGK